MKKIWKYAILLVALSALLCMSAFAADEPTVNNFVEDAVAAVDGKEYFTATYTGQKDAQYLILMLAAETVPESQPAGADMPDPTKTKILYVNQAQAGEDGVVSFETVYPMALEDSVIWLTGGPEAVALASIDVPDPVGVTVSGTVSSYLTGDATVELVKDGETIKTATGAAYEFTEVAVGTYTLKVSKTNHVTREYTINVGETAVTQDAKICPLGDVTGDGKITFADYGKVLSHVKNKTLMTGYTLSCADVTGEGRVTFADYGKVLSHVKNKTKIW